MLLTQTLKHHPCFDAEARGKFGRIHLPVAPACNVQCNFCNRKYDCANESRPGVTSAVLQPDQAADYMEFVLAKEPRLSVAGIAGPGDPFANVPQTLQTLRLIHERFPEMLLCVASNGLKVAEHLDEIAEVGVSHFTITVNAVDPLIGAKVYAWVRDGRGIYRGTAAAELLLDRQIQAIKGLKERGITVKINSIIIPGVNQDHIPAIAEKMAELGADVLNCMALKPVAETPFEDLTEPSAPEVADVRRQAERFLPQMRHCTRCRSDAVGLLGEDRTAEFSSCLSACAAGAAPGKAARPYVAVATWEGMLINQHLGEAAGLWIFRESPTGFELVAKRPTPPAGGGEGRWSALADLLSDCRAVLVSGVGGTPKNILRAKGVNVIEAEGVIEEGLNAVYGNRVDAVRKRRSRGCGDGCTGAGHGCG